LVKAYPRLSDMQTKGQVRKSWVGAWEQGFLMTHTVNSNRSYKH